MEAERMELSEAVERVDLMASGEPTWDLSDNDREALRAVLTALSEREQLIRQLATELAYVHEAPTLELCKTSEGERLLSDPRVQSILKGE